MVSRSRTVNPPHGDLVLSGASICASPNLNILGVKFDSRFTFKDHVHGIISCVSQRIGIWGCWCMSLYIPLCCLVANICICSPNPRVLFSGVEVCSARCLLRLLDRQVYSVARLCPEQISCHCVIDVVLLHCACCTKLIRTFSELPSASVRVWHIQAAAAAHP